MNDTTSAAGTRVPEAGMETVTSVPSACNKFVKPVL
jgi:hypothetical protein